MATMRSPNQTIHSHNREFWTKFFLLYESLPALWDSRSPLYKIRAAKISGYDILVDKLREIEPNADREDVLRKINIFRTNYRREISRINMSNKMGKHYKTTLWYFELLGFLKTQENRRERKVTVDGEKCILPKRRLTGLGSQAFVVKQQPRSKPNKSKQEETLEYDDTEISYSFDDENVNLQSESITNENHNQNHIDENITKEKNYQSEFQTTEPKLETQEIDGYVDDIDDIMQIEYDDNIDTVQEECITECENETIRDWSANIEAAAEEETINNNQITYEKKFKPTNSGELSKTRKNIQIQTQQQRQQQQHKQPSMLWERYVSVQASEILAKSWAVQYDEMSDDQKIYARKAIADILFEGCMGNLGKNILHLHHQQHQHQQQQHHNSHQQDNHQSLSDNENTVHVAGAVVINGRSLLKQQQQQQQLSQQYHDVENDLEECYVFDDGRAVKFQDWAAKMK